MLDQVLTSQAVLGALTFLASALSVAFLLLFGGLAVGAIARKWFGSGLIASLVRFFAKASVWLGFLTLGMTCVVCGMAYLHSGVREYNFDVDLSGATADQALKQFQNQLDTCGAWKIGEKTYENCIFEGHIHLKLRFSKNRVFEETGNALWATGSGERLTSLHFFSSPLTFDELVARREPMLAAWQIPIAQFEEWKKSSVVGSNGALYFYAPEEGREVPWTEISVRKHETPTDETHPWTSSVKWNWEK